MAPSSNPTTAAMITISSTGGFLESELLLMVLHSFNGGPHRPLLPGQPKKV
jgi:hypothetical protein